ncbi:hypothetical protein N9089_03020 [Crocinitomicaceae bacterium]|nr:hypothetical protein [Crocinitomicaceae bacterium]
MSNEQIFKLTFWTSILLYITSLFFSGYSLSKGNSENYGFFLVLFGWSEVFSEGAGYVWLANPLLWYAWYSRKNNRKSLVLVLLSTILALAFLFSSHIMPVGTCGSWLDGSDCGPIEILSTDCGYYLWLASTVVFAVANILKMRIS